MTSSTVRIGGLMRCCLETLDEAMGAARIPPKEGDIIKCRYECGSQMIFHDAAWEWDKPKPKPEDPFDIFAKIKATPKHYDPTQLAVRNAKRSKSKKRRM